MPDIEDAGIAATPLGGQVDEAERQRRDFIRAHHPDRGGDPDIFVAGLFIQHEAGTQPATAAQGGGREAPGVADPDGDRGDPPAMP